MTRGIRTGGLVTRLHVMLLVPLVVVAGCTARDEGDATGGGAGTVDAVGAPSDEDPAEQTPDPQDNGPSGAGPEGEDPVDQSPLQRFLGGATAPLDEATRGSLNDELMRDLRERERLIAECMAAQGFTYHPMDPSDWPTERAGGDVWLLPEDEFAAQYGFGITTIDRQEDPEAAFRSPNEGLLDSMSDAERREWLAALHGDGSFGGLDMGEEGEEGEEGEAMPPFEGVGEGCFGEAHEAIAPTDEHAERLDAEYEGLFEEFSALERRIAADPRAEAATNRWSDCMADAGYPGLARPGDAEQIVHDRIDELTDGGTVADLRTRDRDALQALEIELAVAEHVCMEDFVVVNAQIRRDHEERFVEAHRAELERFRDAMTLAEQS